MVTERKRGACGVWRGTAALGLCLCSSFGLAAEPKGKACQPPPASTIVVNVKDKGAKGDGRTDDTAAIQAAIDAVAGTKGTVLVPDGVYMIQAVRWGLQLKSGMTFKLAPGATLKAIPNGAERYVLLRIAGASNVWVTGGTLEGERHQHKNKAGQWGMGIHISRGSSHITVTQVTSKNMWGDGFYIQGAEDVRLCQVFADNNRRQGLSIINVKNLLVTDSVFQNTHGTRPGAGIDVEPDHAEQAVSGVRIENSKFINNAGGGVRLNAKKGYVSGLVMTGNLFKDNTPFVIKNAAENATLICGNRQESTQTVTADGFSSFAEPIRIVSHQTECGETSFVKTRGAPRKPRR